MVQGNSKEVTRRHFLKVTAAATAAFGAPSLLGARERKLRAIPMAQLQRYLKNPKAPLTPREGRWERDGFSMRIKEAPYPMEKPYFSISSSDGEFSTVIPAFSFREAPGFVYFDYLPPATAGNQSGTLRVQNGTLHTISYDEGWGKHAHRRGMLNRGSGKMNSRNVKVRLPFWDLRRREGLSGEQKCDHMIIWKGRKNRVEFTTNGAAVRNFTNKPILDRTEHFGPYTVSLVDTGAGMEFSFREKNPRYAFSTPGGERSVESYVLEEATFKSALESSLVFIPDVKVVAPFSQKEVVVAADSHNVAVYHKRDGYVYVLEVREISPEGRLALPLEAGYGVDGKSLDVVLAPSRCREGDFVFMATIPETGRATSAWLRVR